MRRRFVARRPDRGRPRRSCCRRHEDAVEFRRHRGRCLDHRPCRRCGHGPGQARGRRPWPRPTRSRSRRPGARARLCRAACSIGQPCWAPARTSWPHADGVAADPRIDLGAAPPLLAAAYPRLRRRLPEPARSRWSSNAFGASLGKPGRELTRRLVQDPAGGAREAQVGRDGDAQQRALQTERMRKMLLAFSRDLRVVLLRLASRLQTLRFFAATKTAGARPRSRASRCRCSRRSPTGSASGRSNGRSRTWRSASCEPEELSPASPNLLRRTPHRARGRRRGLPPASSPAQLERRRHPRGGAGPAQASLQHLEEDAAARGSSSTRVFDIRAMRVIVDDVAARATRCSAACNELLRALDGPTNTDDYIAQAQAQRLPVVAHRGAGRERPARSRCRSARTRDGRPCRARRGRALGLQGSGRARAMRA